jgi:hypothetical protein
MLCILTHRSGTFDDFRKAWERDPELLPDGLRERLRGERAYHVRSLADENGIISFHLTNLTLEGLLGLRERFRASEDERQRALAEFVEWTGADGIFEVVEEITFD